MGRFVLSLIVVAACLLSDPASGQTPTPTPGGDCCSVHAGPSCDISACAACVCDELEEPVCCAPGSDEGWDAICVGLASSAECEAVCGCGTAPTPTPTPGGDCCTAHEGASCDEASCASCVCAIDDICCESTWDATCVSIARNVEECAAQCTTCTPLPTEPPDVTPTPGPCCEGRDLNPGCDEPVCEACVCDVDPVCCSDTWDASCAVIAAEECALSCICPDDGACCDGHGGLGCNDRQCQDCVLEIDSACGDLGWDSNCASEAANECALECPCGDCCAAETAPGCGDKFCQDCVCDVDEECCDPEIGWDERCESIARAECSIACPCNECCEPQDSGSEIVGCGDKECQDCVCALDSNCCELEWDGICAARAAEECERRCMCEPVNDCCVAGDQSGCSLPACEACVCEIDSFCCDEFWDVGCAEDLATASECASVCQCGAVGDCPGDCNGNGLVAINELISGVRISLGEADLAICPEFDTNGNGQVSIAELIQAVNAALDGCP